MKPHDIRWMMATLAGTALLASAAVAPAKYYGGGGGGGSGRQSCLPQQFREALASTGADADASADARLRTDDRCRFDFRVEVEDVPVGTYTLVGGGVDRGTIAVQARPTGTEGEIEFKAGDDDSRELPLNFDPLGATIEIRSAEAIFFSALFDGVADGAASTPVPTRTAIPTNPPATRTPTVVRTQTNGATPAATRTRTDDRGRNRRGRGSGRIGTSSSLSGATIQVKCERRANRSRISVDGNNLLSGSYRAQVSSGANTAASGLQATSGDEVEFDFDSAPNNIAAGATAIAPTFIQGAPAQVTATILDPSGNAVVSATASCRTR